MKILIKSNTKTDTKRGLGPLFEVQSQLACIENKVWRLEQTKWVRFKNFFKRLWSLARRNYGSSF